MFAPGPLNALGGPVCTYMQQYEDMLKIGMSLMYWCNFENDGWLRIILELWDTYTSMTQDQLGATYED